MAWVYLYFYMPETMGKSMEQIQQEFMGKPVEIVNDGNGSEETDRLALRRD